MNELDIFALVVPLVGIAIPIIIGIKACIEANKENKIATKEYLTQNENKPIRVCIDIPQSQVVEKVNQLPKKKLSEKLKKLSYSQKIFTGFALLSIWFLIVLVAEENVFSFTFFRIIISATMIGFLLEKLSIWHKFIIGLTLIMYNPIIQIHLDDEDDWMIFNWIALILIVLTLIILFVKLYKSSEPSEIEE